MPLNIGGNIINSEIVKKYPTTKISKAGLILHLDAFTPESYPGIGTVWYDLSGNANNFNIVAQNIWILMVHMVWQKIVQIFH